MGALKSGVYAPKNHVTVTVWPKPDPDGNGEDVYEDRYNPDTGEYLGRDQVLADDGKTPLRHYDPPEGFVNVPSRDPGSDGETDNYVRAGRNGRGVYRNHLGQAVGIRPGTALLEYGDGTHELLTDDYSQKRFMDAHEEVPS